MTQAQPMAPRSVADEVALAVQGLRRAAAGGFDALVRIDNRTAEANAPFQFDAARGLLHRRGCRAIPPNAPLFGLTSIGGDVLSRVCRRCKPVPEASQDTKATDRADMLFGLVSLVDQFAGVLKERGKDYRQTAEGQHLGTQLGAVYQSLGAREKDVLDVVLTTLDQVVTRLRALDGALNQNGTKGND
jgi:hypothetical protein